MIKIEIKTKTIKDEDGSQREKKFLIVNGIPDEESFFDEKGRHYSTFYNDEVIDIIKKQSFKEIGEHFFNVGFGIEEKWWEESWIDVDINCKEFYSNKVPCIRINLQLQDWEDWAKPWSISSLAQQFEINVNIVNNDNLKYWQEDEETVLNGFGIEYFSENDTLLIGDELVKTLNLLEVVVRNTRKNLLTSIDSEAVLTYFQFPEDIKTACKQYLVYFTQFIADMGIAVDTELKEELNHTLFKIVPKNKEESLDKIREALNIYMNAPSDKNFEIQIANQTDISVKQWEANIYHLKSQLLLYESTVQAKNATIEVLQLSNYQYRQLLESPTVKKETDKEQLFGGTVELKKYDGKGFNIDLPKIFRQLKRRFGRK